MSGRLGCILLLDRSWKVTITIYIKNKKKFPLSHCIGYFGREIMNQRKKIITDFDFLDLDPMMTVFPPRIDPILTLCWWYMTLTVNFLERSRWDQSSSFTPSSYSSSSYRQPASRSTNTSYGTYGSSYGSVTFSRSEKYLSWDFNSILRNENFSTFLNIGAILQSIRQGIFIEYYETKPTIKCIDKFYTSAL